MAPLSSTSRIRSAATSIPRFWSSFLQHPRTHISSRSMTKNVRYDPVRISNIRGCPLDAADRDRRPQLVLCDELDVGENRCAEAGGKRFHELGDRSGPLALER